VIPGRLVAVSLVAVLAAAGASVALAQALPPGVDNCLAGIEEANAAAAAAAKQSNAERTPAVTLGDVCPEVAAALAENPWGKALAGVSPDDLHAELFVVLNALVERYEHTPAGAERPALPSAAALDEALAQLKLEKPAPLTIWQRIQQWYEENFGARGDEARGWLETWLRRFAPSERVVSYLVIMLGIVLVAVTIAIVHNELRVAGVLGRGMLRKYALLAPSSAESEPEHVRDLDDVARAPLARRPVLLLALVLDRLRARGGLSLRDSLTHRELRGAARLSAWQSDAFGIVLDAAERVTFADWQPADGEIDPVLARGRELLSSLAAEVVSK